MKLKITAIILALVLCFGLIAGCAAKDDTAGSGDKINTNIILVLEDGTEKTYALNVTSGATLREALFEAGLITEETYYAMFVDNIDGNVADVFNDGCTWMPTDTEGTQIMGTFDDIIVKDGETIKLVYTVVPNFDD